MYIIVLVKLVQLLFYQFMVDDYLIMIRVIMVNVKRVSFYE